MIENSKCIFSQAKIELKLSPVMTLDIDMDKQIGPKLDQLANLYSVILR